MILIDTKFMYTFWNDWKDIRPSQKASKFNLNNCPCCTFMMDGISTKMRSWWVVEETSSARFFLAMTLYFIVSTIFFMFTSYDSQSLGVLLSIIYSCYFYLPIWILLSLMCAVSRRVRYSIILICFALPIQIISVTFNRLAFGDDGQHQCTKVFIQQFLDTSCNGAWINHSEWIKITLLYAAWVVIFTINTLWSRFISREVR